MPRTQFTFYESFFQALSRIKKKQDRADAYDMICNYALYGKMPDLDKSPDSVAIAFDLLRPVLDKAKERSESGKKGGSKPGANSKQIGSKPEANSNLSGSKKEKEKEKEIEIEIEKEIDNISFSGGGVSAPVEAASEEELALIGLKPGDYPFVSSSQVSETIRVANSLFSKYRPGAKPIPLDYCAAFRHVSIPGGEDLLSYAFEQAALAGKVSDWRYIHGIMDRLSLRGIETSDQARAYDSEME